MKLRRIGAGEIPWNGGALDLPDVAAIVDGVRSGGDAALARFAAQFGDPPPRRIAASDIDDAYRTADVRLLRVLRSTGDRIVRFAMMQREALRDVSFDDAGTVAGHRAVAVERVGIYVPAGRFPLPSTVLMCAIPARVAGVRDVVLCTPRATAETLVAAREAGVDRCFEIGGAQAIAAMAYGTELVPRVDLIVGPGNAYVTAAKRAVFGDCGIDLLAGPSELVVIASGDARPDLIAADLLAQAEHDAMARVMLVTADPHLADAVDVEVGRQFLALPSPAVAGEALRRHGCCALLPLDRAPELVNAVAPEHLELHGAAAEALEPHLHAYGSLFVGSSAAEVFGDYGAGPNHVLPTGGSARFSAGLSVLTFLKLRTYVRATAASSLAIDDAAWFARLEGLIAHERAATLRRRA